MEAVKTEVRKVKAKKVPELKELFVPCPICGGTTDIDLYNRVICHSCQQKWTLAGEAIIEENGTQIVSIYSR